MKILGNILWFLFGGFISWVCWTFYGILWCITIIGIPIGIQCFKFAKLTLAPFGKQVKYSFKVSSVILNVIWIIFTGVPMAIVNAIIGTIWCITIVGIPFGVQYYKIAKLALAPVGTKVK